MTPEERVRLFLDAMHEWERRVFPKAVRATDAEMKAWVGELRAIFDAHLTAKGKGPKNWGKKIRTQRRTSTRACQTGSTDQEIVHIVEPFPKKKTSFHVSRRRAETRTRRSASRSWSMSMAFRSSRSSDGAL